VRVCVCVCVRVCACVLGRPVRALCDVFKCVMVKVGGNEKHRKHVKTRKLFYEIRGKVVKVGGI